MIGENVLELASRRSAIASERADYQLEAAMRIEVRLSAEDLPVADEAEVRQLVAKLRASADRQVDIAARIALDPSTYSQFHL